MKTIIYVLEKNNTPFYVGKTKNPKRRLQDHQLTYGKETIMKELDIIYSTKRDDWKPYEVAWIQIYKEWGYELTNGNKGGSGPIGWQTLEGKIIIGKKAVKNWYEKNKDKYKLHHAINSKNFREKNPDYMKQWHQDNKEKKKEYMKQYHLNKKLKNGK